jgi:hypothetical protein
MAGSAAGPSPSLGRRPSLSEIDAIVSARLDPTRVPGNARRPVSTAGSPCISRHV